MKKLIATILTITMLTSVASVVTAFADAWTPTSSDDGYTKVLADYDMESLNGISGTQKMKYPGFDNNAIDTTDDWTAPKADYADNFSVVSASDANLPDAAAHGYVLKHTGSVISEAGTDTANNVIYTNKTPTNYTATKAVVQVDMYIEEMSSNCIEPLSVNATVGTENKFNLSPIRLMPDGKITARNSSNAFVEVGSFVTNKWYTITVAYDISGETNTYSAWLDDELLVNNMAPGGQLKNASKLRQFNLYMSWKNSEVTTVAPTIYWDNMRVYSGDTVISGSPAYNDSELITAKATDAPYGAVDSPVADDNHGKVIKLTSSNYSVQAVTNPYAMYDEFAPVAPSDMQIAEYSQIKLETDIYFTELDESANKVRLGVKYIDSTGAAKEYELFYLNNYYIGWHNVVAYIDTVNKTASYYVDGAYVGEKTIPDITVPYGMYVFCKGSTIYVDNMKFSVPEYFSEFGGGIECTGTQKMNDSTIGDSINRNDWEIADNEADYFSVVSATDENLPNPVSHGNVIKHVGLGGTVEKSGTSAIRSKSISGATKAVMQVDMYIETMSNNFIDVFNVAQKDTADKTVWDGPAIRFFSDGRICAFVNSEVDGVASDKYVEIGTFETGKWYTVTLELDIASTKRTMSVYVNGELLLDKATPCRAINSCKNFHSYKYHLSWNKGTDVAVPVIYWDNAKAYVGDDAAVNGIRKPVYAITRQGENKYNLAYVLEGGVSSSGTLIAAVYSSDDLLSSVSFGESKNTLDATACELIVTPFEMNEGDTLTRMLWQDFESIRPLTSEK